jgi:hypothetical protein
MGSKFALNSGIGQPKDASGRLRTPNAGANALDACHGLGGDDPDAPYKL